MVIAGSYEDAVKMMGDLNFLQSLIHFPKEAICDETVELLQVEKPDARGGCWRAACIVARVLDLLKNSMCAVHWWDSLHPPPPGTPITAAILLCPRLQLC